MAQAFKVKMITVGDLGIWFDLIPIEHCALKQKVK